MTEDTTAQGVIQALVERLEKIRLPIALQLLDKVNTGEKLSDRDIMFLENVLADAGKIKPLLDSHPEWQPLAARMLGLYNEITAKALENESREAGQD